MELVASRLDNDTRGWIMAIVSGVACVLGAAIICVDVIVRLLPGKRRFRIQDSNVFLASSLSLSFGVMLFSSLFSMLPESKEYLTHDEGWNDQRAGFVMMACFCAGFLGIQAVSRLLHQYMPSHVVDCNHSHAEADAQPDHRVPRRRSSVGRARLSRPSSARPASKDGPRPSEATPLLAKTDGETPQFVVTDQSVGSASRGRTTTTTTTTATTATTTTAGSALSRRPSMYHVQKRVMSFVKDTKCGCDEEGLCYGYTDPCGQECFKHLSTKRSSRHPTTLRTTTGLFPDHHDGVEPVSPLFRTSRAASREPLDGTGQRDGDEHPLDQHLNHPNAHHHHLHHHHHDDEDDNDNSTDNDYDHVHDHDHDHDHAHAHDSDIRRVSLDQEDGDNDTEAQHHHHVPTNAFLSIGLQTSIAIALHKFPEGFITYATNHANPALGFNVFMALFVHNITEGFALALPLYMALGSRWRAMLWSALLGGLSQPMGAAIAALWFRLASRTHLTPNAVAYACLFAATAGIMVSVALQLFVESLSLNHDRNLCIFFGFLGMVLMGFSNALFAAH
ncbi:hypothetical protein L249_6423 [Ophiocordyceps polyrhachis-furcata BCC 54312]|uniref:Uncharacterized protein n=1 Tax=Ophiocordyceps polyrhachis-furcata BCC 54312 TaxID=1330021 RepID=A0A367LL72_9HYPO|nr:hypothetical protein L249_6423 [Ophiocordyceps polyrhachis-furcata BCC 54312]